MVGSARLPGGGRGERSKGEKTGRGGQREKACQEGLPSLPGKPRGAGGGGRTGPLTLVVAPWRGDGEGRGVGGPMKVGEGCEGGELLRDTGEVSGSKNSDRTPSAQAVLGTHCPSQDQSVTLWAILARTPRCRVTKDFPVGKSHCRDLSHPSRSLTPDWLVLGLFVMRSD